MIVAESNRGRFCPIGRGSMNAVTSMSNLIAGFVLISRFRALFLIFLARETDIGTYFSFRFLLIILVYFIISNLT